MTDGINAGAEVPASAETPAAEEAAPKEVAPEAEVPDPAQAALDRMPAATAELTQAAEGNSDRLEVIAKTAAAVKGHLEDNNLSAAENAATQGEQVAQKADQTSTAAQDAVDEATGKV